MKLDPSCVYYYNYYNMKSRAFQIDNNYVLNSEAYQKFISLKNGCIRGEPLEHGFCFTAKSEPVTSLE